VRVCLIAALALTSSIRAGQVMDACEQKLPPSLRQSLAAKFPGFRPAGVHDQDRDATKAEKKAGRDGCLTVAQGDFDGAGIQDVALLLTKTGRPKAGSVLLVAALHRAGAWDPYRLPTFCAEARSCYVQTEKPGVFNRSEALDGPLSGPYERERLESRTDSILSGTLESTGIVHVFSKGEWVYVW